MRSPRSTSSLLGAVVAICLVWAGVEARHIRWGGHELRVTSGPTDGLRRVKEEFASIHQSLDVGDREQAVLSLRERTERGPHPGYAWFLLGELAYEEGAYPAAVQHYRRAVAANPVLADRGNGLGTAEDMDRKLTALLTGAWKEQRPREVHVLYELRRRLGGGCE